MAHPNSNQSRFITLTTWLGLIALVLFSFTFSQAQNTKGDKPAASQKSVSKSKSKKRAGKRVRAKGKSPASRAIQSVRTRKPSENHNYRPEGGEKLKIQSASAKMARNNVYPRNNPYTNNSSPKPKESPRVSSRKVRVQSSTAQMSRNNIYSRNYPYIHNTSPRPRETPRFSTKRVQVNSATARVSKNNVYSSTRNQYVNNPHTRPKTKTQVFSNRKTLKRVGRLNTKPESHDDRKNVTIRSTSSPYFTRGRKNVYWGKFKFGERPYTTDITGRPLRQKNYQSPPLEFVPPSDAYKKHREKNKGERIFKQNFVRGNVTMPKESKPWIGNISGNPISTKPPRVSQPAGKMIGQRNFSISNQQSLVGRPLRIVGLVRKSQSGKISNQKITNKAPGIGAISIDRSLGKYRGGKKPKLFGSRKGGFNNNGRPIDTKAPGIGGRFIDLYSGNIKAMRPLKGGGTTGGKIFNNKGRPIDTKAPGIGGRFIDLYSGNIKATRPMKGGGTTGGKIFNNKGRPIDTRAPGIGGRFIDLYSGNIKASRPQKGGGSISGKIWNNSNQPILVKAPASLQAKFVDVYQGFGKSRKAFSRDGYTYSGNKKIWRDIYKGGGSISGKLWNNNNKPITPKAPAGSIQAKYIDIYQGYYKAHKPVKGGGSVSGKLWNNKEQPIQGTTYNLSQLKVSSYAGEIKVKRSDKYVKNPNANEAALKKAKPNKTTYEVAGLQIKTKAHEYALNKRSSKYALKGESEGKNSLKAIEYANRIKVLWVKTFGDDKDLSGRIPMKKYVHAPNSKKGALMVMSPGKATARIGDFQVNIKMNKPHGKDFHPDSKFANSQRDNVKHERTFLMNIRLAWAKLFRKSSTQPKAVKEKVRRPRYDKNEREVWKDLYD
ncbi:MAG TPA: hypothetical protein DGG95_13790 [Cytophagales bacterium]|nr:hypothetical protein [Cytophagales bacterium]